MTHLAPPAKRVNALLEDLLNWLNHTDVHPLIASCVIHYELEFIHPFEDGNGRMGRLWQTLILSYWQPMLDCIPFELAIYNLKEEYYQALAQADNAGDSTCFIEFMLLVLWTSMTHSSLIKTWNFVRQKGS